MRGSVLGNRYRILDRIGEGGMAFVYVASDEKLGRKVAIKVLHKHMAENEDLRQRFNLEAQAISSLEHPNILKIYDFSGSDSRELWIVTEILEGNNLNDFVNQYSGRLLHPIIATLVVREILKALAAAHGKNIIHRDIKPENIFVLRDGKIKLMDFGIAKNMRENSMTVTGTFMGSPSYMSPEQIRGRQIDHRSDLYSLGVLFYEIVTGSLPYNGSSTHDVVLKICEGQFKEPQKLNPELSDDLNKIIVKAMSMNPAHRYQEARTFARDLDIYLKRSDFAESHIELERYFKSREKFNKRLKGSDGARKKPKPKPAPKPAQPTVHVQEQMPLIRPARKTWHQKSQNTTKPKRKERSVPPTPVYKPQETPPQTTRRQMVSLPQRRIATPAPAVRKRVRPRIPHHRPTAVYVPMRRSSHTTGWFNAFVGVLLVGLIGMIAIWGFVNLQNRLKHRQPPPKQKQVQRVLPKKPVRLKTPTQIKKPRAQKPSKKATPTTKIKTKPKSRSITPTTRTKTPAKTVKPNKKLTPKPANKTEPVTIKKPEPKPKPIAPGPAYVRISSSPAAKVIINGKSFGTTIDQTINSGWLKLESGEHRLELRRSGFQVYRRNFTLKPNQRRSLPSVKLVSTAKVQLRISTVQKPVRIMIQGLDDRSRRTYNSTSGVLSRSLAPGRYLIRLQHGNKTIERTINLSVSQRQYPLSIDFGGGSR